ncbi:PAS domain-containing protein [Rhizobium tumorigenes]|uniref:PAS domain-containing protein n=1 Tax=Rhizobium tumorigenes TaxID=2041385 RepID=UPI00241FB8BF|nr:PAS domain-containing protein [Rhizobium tumorigenes]WFS02404.1 PAS domain-containing protein [Rhizobium tumorigenes]
MRLDTSFELFTYWNSTRGIADAPLRSEIDPGAIRHMLPRVFILEAADVGGPRFRLAGTMICSLFGRELRDMPFSSLWTGQGDDAVTFARGVMDGVSPAVLNATGNGGYGRSMTFEVILLPMRSSPDRCDRVLGCLVATSKSTWLGMQPLAGLRLDRGRTIDSRTGLREPETPAPRSAASALASKRLGLSLAVRRALNL